LTVLAIIVLGTFLHIQGKATIGQMVTFMNFAGLIIIRLEQSVSFINRVVADAAAIERVLSGWDTVPAIRRYPDAVDQDVSSGTGRVQGRVGSHMMGNAWRPWT